MQKPKQCYREQLIKFSKGMIKPTVWAAARRRTFFAPHGRTIDFRMYTLSTQMYIRIRPNPWVITRVFPRVGRIRKHWCFVCPTCLGYCKFLYLHDDGAVHCSACEPLPSMLQHIKSSSIVKKGIAAARYGDFSELQTSLKKGGRKAFRARQALELIGMLPQLYTPKPSYKLSLRGTKANDKLCLVSDDDWYYVFAGGELCKRRQKDADCRSVTGTAVETQSSSGDISFLQREAKLSNAELRLVDFCYQQSRLASGTGTKEQPG